MKATLAAIFALTSIGWFTRYPPDEAAVRAVVTGLCLIGVYYIVLAVRLVLIHFGR